VPTVYRPTPTKQEEEFKQSRAVTGSPILAQQQAIRGALQSLIPQECILGLVLEAEAEQDFTGILQWAREGLHLLGVTANALPVEPLPTSCARRARGSTTVAPSVSAATGKFTATHACPRPRSDLPSILLLHSSELDSPTHPKKLKSVGEPDN